MMPEVLSPAVFIQRFAAYFDVLPTEVSLSSTLAEDLGFDSVMFLEVADMLDEASDSPVPDQLLESLVTVGDVYHYYSVFADGSRGRER